jgi:hypothetical protein
MQSQRSWKCVSTTLWGVQVFPLELAEACATLTPLDPIDERHRALASKWYLSRPGKRILIGLGLSAAVGASALLSVPALAATPMSFDITSGALSITAPSAGVSLGTQVASTSAFTISGQLGIVTVTDGRGGATSWTTSAIATAFTPSSGPADPASNVGYASGPFTISGGVTPVETDASNLTGVVPVVSATSTGISSVSWNPTISVLVPADYAPGVYLATITQSVA